MNTALEYSTRVVQEGGRRCKKSTLNDLVHLTPLRIPLMNPPLSVSKRMVRMNTCTPVFIHTRKGGGVWGGGRGRRTSEKVEER
jgi:hypothetical protein